MIKTTFKYKCQSVTDPETNEFRKKCSMCALSQYLPEQGLKYTETEGEHKCPHTGSVLTLESKKEELAVPAMGMKMGLNEIKKERTQRSRQDFKTNIFPKFQPGSAEHEHFKDRV